MFIKCDVEVNYRLQCTQSVRGPSRKCRGAIGLYRKNEEENKSKKCSYVVVVYTNKSKNGVKYRVMDNIKQIFSRFVDDGRATISFKDPQHDVCISKADSHSLKKLVHGVKLGSKGEDVPDVRPSVQGAGLNILEKSQLEMKILSRKDYPLTKPFPSSMEKLHVNNCKIVKFDCRLLRIVTLRTLNFSNNQLTELPESLDTLVNLKELILAKNKFRTVPTCLFNPVVKSNLRLLDLSSNLLESLPIQICLMCNLTNLRLDDNKITALPYNIAMLKSLRYFSVAQNNITLLPYGFSSLNIDSLDLSRNPLGVKSAYCVVEMNLQKVPTLFEITSRVVVGRRIKYSEEMLPQGILRYLDSAKVCLCGRVCFESYALYITMLDLGRIAHTVTADVLDAGRMSAPAEGFLCSFKCCSKWTSNPNTMWK